MDKIIQGVRQFQTEVFPGQKPFYRKLAAKVQNPKALFITCSDSRVVPNTITSTEPGDLFQIRNAGNLVPPFGASLGGEVATIEYAVTQLNVQHLIVCGHSQCGAIEALLKTKVPDDLIGLKAWFRHAQATRQIVQRKHSRKKGDALHKAATEENVLVQVNNLSTHPCIAAGLATGELCVYGWYYDIASGSVLQFDQSQGTFVELGDMALGAAPLPIREF